VIIVSGNDTSHLTRGTQKLGKGTAEKINLQMMMQKTHSDGIKAITLCLEIKGLWNQL